MVSRVLWSPEGLVEVRISWPGHPRYQKKNVLRYLHGTSDIKLFYFKTLEPQLFDYANVDADYLSDPYNAQSQTRYIFTYGNTVIS